MCDTQILVADGAVWFAKNSDREPDEPQAVVRLPAARGDAARTLRTTYLEIEQVPDRHAVILSKPVWMWGAEMGVNERGVAIGNEAIFSRRVSREPALLGMDLVRLGLERGDSARAALDVIARLLERHGQGGPGGFRDKSFRYDNSFLIADHREAWVLETAGRDWAAKRIPSPLATAMDGGSAAGGRMPAPPGEGQGEGANGAYAISNQLTLADNHDLRSAGVAQGTHFARRFDTRLMPFFAGSAARRARSLSCLAETGGAGFARFASHLRQHHAHNEDPRRGSNRDVCMHAAGFIRRHQTTGSTIARLAPQGATLLFTGTSAPCLSIFRPVAFEGEFSVLTPAERAGEAPLWYAHEAVHRRALFDAELRRTLRATRDETENKLFALLDTPAPDLATLQHADRLAAAWQMVLLREAQRRPVKLSRFWTRLSRAEGTLA